MSETPDRGCRRRYARLVGAGLGTLAIASGTVVSAGDAVAAPTRDSRAAAAARVDQSLDQMAKLFARAVSDPALRQQIHDGVAKRFDGDNDLLYTTLASTSKVRTALTGAYGAQRKVAASDAASAVDRIAASIPRFQVSVPTGFAKWNAASFTPLVASVPNGVEDTTLKTITAYDTKGTAHTLNAQVAPLYPVIVLGLNERTDNSGRLTRQFSTPANQSAAAAAASTYQVRVTKVHLSHDNEPWPKGDAEISLRAQGCGLDYTDINWTSLNDDEDWYVGPRYLGNTHCGGYFYWWEDDGSNFDFTLSYKGVSLNVKMDDDDDLIGGVLLGNATFAGDSDQKTTWSDLQMWTD